VNKDTRNSPDINEFIRKYPSSSIAILYLAIVIFTGFLVNQIVKNKSIVEAFSLNLDFFYTRDQVLESSFFILLLIGFFFVSIAYFALYLTEDKNIILYLYLTGFLVISISVSMCITLDADLRQQPIKLVSFLSRGLWTSIFPLPSISGKVDRQSLYQISLLILIFYLALPAFITGSLIY
jgi:hypothetical protein